MKSLTHFCRMWISFRSLREARLSWRPSKGSTLMATRLPSRTSTARYTEPYEPSPTCTAREPPAMRRAVRGLDGWQCGWCELNAVCAEVSDLCLYVEEVGGVAELDGSAELSSGRRVGRQRASAR